MTNASLNALSLFLFVPADRPVRFGKAMAAGADAVILDLEDGVDSRSKGDAREALAASADLIKGGPCPAFVRINALEAGGEADLEILRNLPIAGVVAPKAETVADVRGIAERAGAPVVALVETARGLAAARELARACARLAFGSIDFAADLGCRHTRPALAQARAELVLASRLAGLPGPIDGVTTSIEMLDRVRDDAAHAAELGFEGKLLIHPAQVAPAIDGFHPSDEELDWAEKVLSGGGGGASNVAGTMVDAPVRQLALRIRARARRSREKNHR